MKQRKTVLAALLAAALLPWLTVSAKAADTDVMFSDPGAVVGNSVTVNVYTTSAVAGIDLTLVYDTDYLTYTGASGGLGNAAVQDNGGSLRIVDYSGSGEGKFSLNLSFTARAVGTTALRPTACSASNAGGDAVSVEYASHSASVTITSASSDCTLSALYIDPGTLSPAFSANVTNYAVTVPYETAWLAVSAVKNDAAATAAVSGNGSLSVGLNYVTVTVTAGNGAQRVYTLAVTRQAQDTAAQPTSDNHVDTTEPEIPEATPAAGRTIFTAEGRTYTILDAATLSARPPEGCVLGDYALLGSVCRAYLPEDGGEYVVFYARPEGGEPELYIYDTREETMQRYGLITVPEATLTPEPSPSAEPTPSPAPETPDASDAEIENLRWTVTVLAVAAAVLFIGAAVLGTLLIRSITRPVRKDKNHAVCVRSAHTAGLRRERKREMADPSRVRVVDEEISLVPYYPNEETALPWYQDPDVCRQVDNIDHVYTSERLNAMYTYLSTHGACYYISYRGVLVGDVSLRNSGELAIVICREYQNRHIGRRCIRAMLDLAREKGMERVTANIYSFNTQSRNMFLSLGFRETGGEWFALEL